MEDGMKALALVHAPDHVCCRYRVRAYEPALEAAGCALKVEGLATATLGRLRQLRRAAAFDVVLLQRKLLRALDLHVLRKYSRRLIFDFDDAVLYRDSYHRRGVVSARLAARFARTVQFADNIIAGNEYLRRCAIESGANLSRVHHIPTAIDVDRYHPVEKPARDEILELVWVGSSSTIQGLVRQRSLFDRLGREFPGLRLRLICDSFPTFGALPVVAVPWSESTEAEEIARGDIGISWVPDDLWSRGKCGLKVLQYQAAGLPVVANPVGVHTSMIRPGSNGELAATPEDWIDRVRLLATNRARRLQMGRQARTDVVARYSIAVWSARFVAVLCEGAPHLHAERAAIRRTSVA
jgi:glycosyltransferase involved in cell wall biosynthesis